MPLSSYLSEIHHWVGPKLGSTKFWGGFASLAIKSLLPDKLRPDFLLFIYWRQPGGSDSVTLGRVVHLSNKACLASLTSPTKTPSESKKLSMRFSIANKSVSSVGSSLSHSERPVLLYSSLDIVYFYSIYLATAIDPGRLKSWVLLATKEAAWPGLWNLSGI